MSRPNSSGGGSSGMRPTWNRPCVDTPGTGSTSDYGSFDSSSVCSRWCGSSLRTPDLGSSSCRSSYKSARSSSSRQEIPEREVSNLIRVFEQIRDDVRSTDDEESWGGVDDDGDFTCGGEDGQSCGGGDGDMSEHFSLR